MGSPNNVIPHQKDTPDSHRPVPGNQYPPESSPPVENQVQNLRREEGSLHLYSPHLFVTTL